MEINVGEDSDERSSVCLCVCLGHGGCIKELEGKGQRARGGAEGLFYVWAPGSMPGIPGVVVYLNPMFLNAGFLFDLDTVIDAPSLACQPVTSGHSFIVPPLVHIPLTW